MPDQQDLNLQFRFNLKPLTGQNFEGFLDIVNMLALRTTVTVQQQDGPDFGQPLTRKVPIYLRLGFRYHY